MFLRSRVTDRAELMDDPDCNLVALERTYVHFRTINARLAGWASVYDRHIRPLLSSATGTTLLDLGCGGGDVARSLARWARRDGLRLTVTGVDPDTRALAFARAQHPDEGVRFRKASSTELVARGERFDIVISNHVLHHLDGFLEDVLVDSGALARQLVIHNDIARSPLAYVAYATVTLPFRRHGREDATFIRDDGLLSIRRSYRADELRAVAPEGWQVERRVPFRLLLLSRPSSSAASVHPDEIAERSPQAVHTTQRGDGRA